MTRFEEQFPGVVAYFRHAIHIDQTEVSTMQRLRSIYKWLFDLLKNVFAVVALKVVAQRTNSSDLNFLAALYQLILTGYLITYLHGFYIYPFSQRTRGWTLALDVLVMGALTMGGNVALQRLSVKMVSEFAQAQATTSAK